MRLDVCCKVFLRLCVEFNHCVGQILATLSQTNASLEHSFVESSKDLFQGIKSWEVDQNQGAMSQKSRIERFTTNICWRIACSNKLNSFQRDPLSISSPPEAMLLSQLSKESNDGHGRIFISIRKIDLVTEHDEPFTWLFGSQDNSAYCLIVLAIMLELFHDEARVSRRGEVDEDHLKLGESLQS